MNTFYPRKQPARRLQRAPDRPVLTVRHLQILNCIHTHTETHHTPPSVRELCRATGLVSTSNIHYHLNRLAGWGYLERLAGVSRGVRLLDQGYLILGHTPPLDMMAEIQRLRRENRALRLVVLHRPHLLAPTG